MKKTNLSQGDYVFWGYIALMFIVIALFVIWVFKEIISSMLMLVFALALVWMYKRLERGE